MSNECVSCELCLDQAKGFARLVVEARRSKGSGIAEAQVGNKDEVKCRGRWKDFWPKRRGSETDYSYWSRYLLLIIHVMGDLCVCEPFF